MPSKNVYVSADDVELFERAADLAGGLSAAVAAGLSLYVAARVREAGEQAMSTIEVEVQDGPIITTTRFTGRRLLRFEEHTRGRSIVRSVYATAGGRLAIHTRDDADWRALTTSDENAPIWTDPRTWTGEAWGRGPRTFEVFDDVDAVRGSALPAELGDALERALSEPTVIDLDI